MTVRAGSMTPSSAYPPPQYYYPYYYPQYQTLYHYPYYDPVSYGWSVLPTHPAGHDDLLASPERARLKAGGGRRGKRRKAGELSWVWSGEMCDDPVGAKERTNLLTSLIESHNLPDSLRVNTVGGVKRTFTDLTSGWA